ncbi:MAG: M23 family metallopeptidase [Bacteroidales bacterium]
MNYKKPTPFLTWLLFSFITASSFAQVASMDQVTVFSSRVKSPIKFDVKYDTGNVYFNVINSSFFPYTLEIEFNQFSNLSPVVFNEKTVVQPGNTRLYTFRIMNRNVAPELSYKTKYYMAYSNTGDERYGPYLVPIGRGRIVELALKTNESTKSIISNQFVLNPGDTVFAARKGLVTALPDNQVETDRIMTFSLEIRHDDGTIAVYTGLDPGIKLVQMNQKVYPGQPIGVIGDSRSLTFNVFEIKDGGKLSSFEITYNGTNKEIFLLSKIHSQWQHETRIAVLPSR